MAPSPLSRELERSAFKAAGFTVSGLIGESAQCLTLTLGLALTLTLTQTLQVRVRSAPTATRLSSRYY